MTGGAKVIDAFVNGKSLSSGNTRTDGKNLYLFGNRIAEHKPDGLYITNCGWATNTTKDRLNQLPGVSISQSKKIWYLNGAEWNGEWIKANNNPPPAFNPDKVGKAFDETKRYVRTDGWRGYSEPIYAVCGANDTGTWEDSPCNSEVATKELADAKTALGNIPVKHVVCESSNVFCVHRYLIVPPAFYKEASEIMDEYLTSNRSNTELIYAVKADEAVTV